MSLSARRFLASANRPLASPTPFKNIRSPPLRHRRLLAALSAADRPALPAAPVPSLVFSVSLSSDPLLSTSFCPSFFLSFHCFSSTPVPSLHQLPPVPGPDPARAPHHVRAGSGPGTGRKPAFQRGSGVDAESISVFTAQSRRGTRWRRSRTAQAALVLPDGGRLGHHAWVPENLVPFDLPTAATLVQLRIFLEEAERQSADLSDPGRHLALV